MCRAVRVDHAVRQKRAAVYADDNAGDGAGGWGGDRAVINGVQTTLDELRGTPYIQADLRVSRKRWSVIPFIEFFDLFNRNNPGANYVTNVSALPVPPAEVAAGNVTPPHECGLHGDGAITSLNQLRMAGGALGDFFGPGTTVGIPLQHRLGQG